MTDEDEAEFEVEDGVGADAETPDETAESQEPVERRKLERIKVAVKRTILGTIEDDTYGEMKNHFYFVDVSHGGMRINLDRNIEPETRIYIKFSLASLGFGLEGDFESQCRVVWTKPTEGTCILGLEFQSLEQEFAEVIDRLIAYWKPREGLLLERVPNPIDAKLKTTEDEAWSRMFAIRAISTEGCHFRFHKEFEAGEELDLRILLEAGNVEVKSTVRWCSRIPSGAFDVGCDFDELTAESRSFIELQFRKARHTPIGNPYGKR